MTAFDCEFPATAWFGTNVLWLAPRPDEPFGALIRAVSAAFPGYLPFEGRLGHPWELARPGRATAGRRLIMGT